MGQCQLVDSTPKRRLLIPITAKVMPTLWNSQTDCVEGLKRQEMALNGKQWPPDSPNFMFPAKHRSLIDCRKRTGLFLVSPSGMDWLPQQHLSMAWM